MGRPKKDLTVEGVSIKRKKGSGRPPGSTKKVKIFFDSHVKKKGGMLQCTECGESSASRSEMYLHIHRVHTDKARYIETTKEPPSGPQDADAEVNENCDPLASSPSHNGSRMEIVPLNLGARGRPRKEVLKDFIKAHVKEIGDMFECNKCGESCPSLSKMYLHVLSAHINGKSSDAEISTNCDQQVSPPSPASTLYGNVDRVSDTEWNPGDKIF